MSSGLTYDFGSYSFTIQLILNLPLTVTTVSLTNMILAHDCFNLSSPKVYTSANHKKMTHFCSLHSFVDTHGIRNCLETRS